MSNPYEGDKFCDTARHPRRPPPLNLKPYNFEIKDFDQMKNLIHCDTPIGTPILKYPDFHILLDHTIAVLWLYYNNKRNWNKLSISHLEWAIRFIDSLLTSTAKLRDIEIMKQHLEELLIENYAIVDVGEQFADCGTGRITAMPVNEPWAILDQIINPKSPAEANGGDCGVDRIPLKPINAPWMELLNHIVNASSNSKVNADAPVAKCKPESIAAEREKESYPVSDATLCSSSFSGSSVELLADCSTDGNAQKPFKKLWGLLDPMRISSSVSDRNTDECGSVRIKGTPGYKAKPPLDNIVEHPSHSALDAFEQLANGGIGMFAPTPANKHWGNILEKILTTPSNVEINNDDLFAERGINQKNSRVPVNEPKRGKEKVIKRPSYSTVEKKIQTAPSNAVIDSDELFAERGKNRKNSRVLVNEPKCCIEKVINRPSYTPVEKKSVDSEIVGHTSEPVNKTWSVLYKVGMPADKLPFRNKTSTQSTMVASTTQCHMPIISKQNPATGMVQLSSKLARIKMCRSKIRRTMKSSNKINRLLQDVKIQAADLNRLKLEFFAVKDATDNQLYF